MYRCIGDTKKIKFQFLSNLIIIIIMEEEGISYEYKKFRMEFGLKCEFKDTPAQIIHHARSERKQYHLHKLKDRITFSTSDFKEESSAGTSHPAPSHQGMTHQEGGWPIHTNHTEYRDMATRSCIKSLQTVVPSLAFAARTSRATNMLEEYFRGEESVKNGIPEVHEIAKFTDLNDSRRSVSKVVWNHDSTRFATAYCSLRFKVQLSSEHHSTSYIFDVERPDQGPIDKLRPPAPLLCVDFHQERSHLVVGGCYNGLVTLFDLRRGQIPPLSSVVETSHVDPVYDVSWIQGHGSDVFVSASTDGRVMWWDSRRLSEPVDVKSLGVTEDGLSVLGARSLEYTHPNHYAIGSDKGEIVMFTKYLDLVSSSSSDSSKTTDSVQRIQRRKELSQKETCMTFPEAHLSSVVSIKRSPLCPDYFLSIGDWRAQIWHQNLTSPVLSTNYQCAELVDGCWSPTRPGVFFVAKTNGSFDVWDLYDTQTRPVLTQSLGSEKDSLTCVSCAYGGKNAGRLLALGTESGDVRVIRLSDELAICQEAEPVAVSSALDRELKREREMIHAKMLRAHRDSKIQEIETLRKEENEKYHKFQNSMSDVLTQLDAEFLTIRKEAVV